MKKQLNNIILKLRKKAVFILFFLIISCSSTKLISSWKNPEYYFFYPKKILVIGVTSNFEARKTFEFQLTKELQARKINALQSAVVFESSFKDSKQTEKDIEAEVDKLLTKGYDVILISLVKEIDENESFASESSKTDYHLRRFILYYLAYQESYFNQDYYKKYKVFNIETSIYHLNPESNKSLVWQGYFDLVDPNSNSKAIDSYIKKLLKTLEKENIIPKKT